MNLNNIFSEAFRTPVKRNCLEWAKENRFLSASESSHSGYFDYTKTPYLYDIAEAFMQSRYKRIVVWCGGQMAKTEFALNVIGQTIDEAPAPMVLVLPDKELLKSVSNNRIQKMINSNPNLLRKLDGGKRKAYNEYYFNSYRLGLAWASSDAQLCSHPNRIVIIDEVDRIRMARKARRAEGNPVELAESRNTTFNNPKTLIMSTPLIEGESYLYQYFTEGTQMLWCILCPKCNHYIFPDLPLLKWSKDKSLSFHDRAATVMLECPECHSTYTDFQVKGLSKNKGRYLSLRTHLIDTDDRIISEKTSNKISYDDIPDNRTASFRVPGLVSYWRDWKSTVERFLQAVDTKDDESLQSIINVEFGKMFRLGGTPPQYADIYKNRDNYKINDLHNTEIPDDSITTVIGTIDVQHDKFVYVFRGWNNRLDSWLVGFGELFGNTELQSTWDSLEGLLTGAEFIKADGAKVYPRAVFIDSGFNTNAVYAFCLRYKLKGRILPVKGVSTDAIRPISQSNISVDARNRLRKRKKSRISNSERFILYKIKDSYFKSWVHARIRKDFGAEKTWHIPNNITPAYCEELINEYKSISASGREVWLTRKGAHDYLDCEKMNIAGALILGVRDVKKRTPKPIANQEMKSIGKIKTNL